MNPKVGYQCQLQVYQARGDLEGPGYLDGKVKKQVMSLFVEYVFCVVLYIEPLCKMCLADVIVVGLLSRESEGCAEDIILYFEIV
jgi:hypothetical protein